MFFREKKLLSFHVQGVPRGTFKVRVVIVNQPQPESWRVHGVWTSRRNNKQQQGSRCLIREVSMVNIVVSTICSYMFHPFWIPGELIWTNLTIWLGSQGYISQRHTPQDDRCMTAAQKNWKVKVWKHVKICQRNLNYTFVSSHSTTLDNYMDWSLVQRHGLQRPLC